MAEASTLAIGGRFVIVTGAALAVLLLFSYPVDAIDVFVYAIYTRGWGLYGLNPLATAPAQFPGNDPWVGLAAEWAECALAVRAGVAGALARRVLSRAAAIFCATSSR